MPSLHRGSAVRPGSEGPGGRVPASREEPEQEASASASAVHARGRAAFPPRLGPGPGPSGCQAWVLVGGRALLRKTVHNYGYELRCEGSYVFSTRKEVTINNKS